MIKPKQTSFIGLSKSSKRERETYIKVVQVNETKADEDIGNNSGEGKAGNVADLNEKWKEN